MINGWCTRSWEHRSHKLLDKQYDAPGCSFVAALMWVRNIISSKCRLSDVILDPGCNHLEQHTQHIESAHTWKVKQGRNCCFINSTGKTESNWPNIKLTIFRGLQWCACKGTVGRDKRLSPLIPFVKFFSVPHGTTVFGIPLGMNIGRGRSPLVVRVNIPLCRWGGGEIYKLKVGHSIISLSFALLSLLFSQTLLGPRPLTISLT